MYYPSQQYDYSNTNYRILGLIIEKVSGQTYEAFLTDAILLPLGLKNTYADLSKIPTTASVAGGSRLSFQKTWTYEVPVVQANVPAGYIFSNVADMSRWIQIQMGEIEISEQFQRIIKKSHEPNQGSVVDSSTHYAAGWFINDETGDIYHSGGTPNYSTNVSIRPSSNNAVCVLTNMNASANTNHIASNVLNILENKPTTANPIDVWMIFDLIFSIITILCLVGTIAYLFFIIRRVLYIRNGQRKKVKSSKKWILAFLPSAVLMVISALVVFLIPIIFSSSWRDLCLWAPFSLILGAISLFVVAAFSLVHTIISRR
jgi:putative ATP-binding cassette transporter